MKISKVLLGFAAVLVISLSTMGTSANATNNKCEVIGSGLKWGSFFTVNDRKTTAKFTVTGEDCTVKISLVSWKTPSANGQPLYEQKLYAYTTKSFGPGEHKLTVKLPDCYYQADLMVGTKHDWAEADNTPKRFELTEDGQFKDMGLRDFILGGDKKCVDKPTPVPPTPTPTPPQVQGAVTTLPNTGLSFGSILGLGFSVSILGAVVHQQMQKRFSKS